MNTVKIDTVKMYETTEPGKNKCNSNTRNKRKTALRYVILFAFTN